MPKDITEMLIEYRRGNDSAANDLFKLVSVELRKIATRYLSKERHGHTLQPTALVNEAYIKLANQRQNEWQNRSHFLGIAANIMRRILVDHARGKHAEKRGGEASALTLNDHDAISSQDNIVDILALEQAMEELCALDERQAKVVEYKFYGGMNVEEIAEILSISTPTVKRDWAFAKAWLFQRLTDLKAT